MRPKYIVILLAIAAAGLLFRKCEYGPEHLEVAPKYKKAHVTTVSAQNLLKQKKYEEALRYYEAAKAEMEHPSVRADKGEDVYINYGLVLNDIGVIHLAWALYGRDLDTDRKAVDPEQVDPAELARATEALEGAAAFYRRWYAHNPQEYERYARAISETYANLGVAYKYAGRREQAVAALAESLRFYPKNGNAQRSLRLLEVDPQPFVEAGEQAWKARVRFKLF
ncbi:MAG: hypothetical protein Kow0092_36550 [Deferrisomatales bacterium]